MPDPHPTAPASKTFDEHHAMLRDTVRLKLHFAHRWSAEHPDEALRDILETRVDLWHKTHLNTGKLAGPIDTQHPEWRTMIAQVVALHERMSGEADRDRFEEEAFKVFEQSIAERAPLDFANEQAGEHLKAYTCGSLRYHKMDEPGSVFLHIANALSPRSIFEDRRYLPACLRQLLDLAEADCDATQLHTHTWLNAVPAWLALFPEQWQENLSSPDEDVQWHYGFWGQFINARGCFNRKLGRRMRQTGAFPYLPRRSWCDFDKLRAHLDEIES